MATTKRSTSTRCGRAATSCTACSIGSACDPWRPRSGSHSRRSSVTWLRQRSGGGGALELIDEGEASVGPGDLDAGLVDQAVVGEHLVADDPIVLVGRVLGQAVGQRRVGAVDEGLPGVLEEVEVR